MADSTLFHIDTIVIDGQAVAFEDGSAMLTGLHRYEHTSVVTASGDDFARRNRVPTTLRFRLQFTGEQDPQALATKGDVQITARDTQANRRVTLPKCRLGTMGDIGGGGVDVTYLVLQAPQWL